MGENSGIQWTDHTFNPWWGCARVSPACRFCYADDLAKRYGHQVWRRKGPRRMLSEQNWHRPVTWNRDAERLGVPAKVFCASMADVFEDHPQVAEPRKRLWDLIEHTPWLQWQLLTKRPENVGGMVPWGDSWPANVWLGVSVENQRYADERIPLLVESGAQTLFLSCEPLLGPVDLSVWLFPEYEPHCGLERPEVDWVIIGGESGPKARATELGWIEDLLNQCHAARVPPFIKQLGKVAGREFDAGPKGGDMDRWPPYLQHRHFPRTAEAVPA